MSELIDSSSQPGQPPIDVATLEPGIVSSDNGSLGEALGKLQTTLCADTAYIAALRGENQDESEKVSPAELAMAAQRRRVCAKFVPEKRWAFGIKIPDEGVLITSADTIKWGHRTAVEVYKSIGGSAIVGEEIYADYMHAGIKVPSNPANSLVRLRVLGMRAITLGLPASALHNVRLVPEPNAQELAEVTRKMSSLFMADVVI